MSNATNKSTIGSPSGLSRRGMLTGSLLAGGAIAGTVLVPGPASAATPARSGPVGTVQVPGVQSSVDVSHTTSRPVELFSSYFRDKSSANPDRTMAHFATSPFTYIDAILGWPFYTWKSLHDFFVQYMPQWPSDARSYPTRIIGGPTGAVVFFTNTPGMFGPSELRLVGVVDFDRAGKIVRWVDYWDGRHFGIANLDALKLPDSQFPPDFRESTVGENASQPLKRVVASLVRALSDRDLAGATALFSPDATLVDHPSHLHITGRRSIGSFFEGAGSRLPMAGAGLAVRHVVGGDLGGAYEWTASGVVPRGVTTLELDPWGRIARLDAMWDGARVDEDTLLALARAAVER
ncbi:nuclear transport factor 2 family protein [Streptomyces canus]|uniref:nuclear transport factor 2 family protein n=1 Tax=Streptomyces canus TaxID=58343 RepID=UPI0036BA22B6